MDCTITLIVALVSLALNIVILGKVKSVLREVEQPVARKLTPEMNLRSVRTSQRGAPASAPAGSVSSSAGQASPSQGGVAATAMAGAAKAAAAKAVVIVVPVAKVAKAAAIAVPVAKVAKVPAMLVPVVATASKRRPKW